MAEHESVYVVKSTADWHAKLDEAKTAGKHVVVDFTAKWCGPCKQMSPVFEELAKKHPELVFLQVDVDDLTDVAQVWQVQAMPTFIFIKDGTLVHKIVGANKVELVKKAALYASK